MWREELPAMLNQIRTGVCYREMARHYSATILPGRVGAPRDNPSAENTAWNIAAVVVTSLRDQIFTSLAPLRREIHERVQYLQSVSLLSP